MTAGSSLPAYYFSLFIKLYCSSFIIYKQAKLFQTFNKKKINIDVSLEKNAFHANSHSYRGWLRLFSPREKSNTCRPCLSYLLIHR